MKRHELVHDAQEISTSLSRKLSQDAESTSKWRIYKVHEHLRNVNENAYKPEIIAIGPYHRDKPNTMLMEEHKRRYLRHFLHRKNENYIENFVSAIFPLEQEARNSYAETINLNPSEFVEMLVIDGCFIIELLRKYGMPQLREEDDPLFQMGWILESLQRDLILFENQIPFFVLCKLFDLIEIPNQYPRLIHLALSFFRSMNPRRRTELRSCSEIKHLLHLIHNTWYLSYSDHEYDQSKCERNIINCASMLREANVKLEPNEKGSSLDVRFENGVMWLPPLMIEDRTEALLRNMIAYEQYFHKSRSPVTDYVVLLDCLIDSPKDVEILVRRQIIDNWLGNGEVVANMINKLTESVTGRGKSFGYAKVFCDVSLHCSKHRNKWMAKLRHDYLNSPWRIISIVVASLLLFFTLVQTVCSVLQVLPPKNK